MLEEERGLEKVVEHFPCKWSLHLPCVPLGVPYHQILHGGPQNASSSLWEGVRSVFTINTETGDKTCIPYLHILQATTMSSWIVGAGGHYSGTSPRNVCRNALETVVL
jgi:hypothetical protein